MEMIIGKYRFIQHTDGYVIEDTTLDDEIPTVINVDRMEKIIEDIYTDYLE